MTKIKGILLVLVGGLFLTFAPSGALAADNLGYTVTPVQPKKQIDPTKDYFYVETRPGETQTLEVRVKSTQKEERNIKISGANAITGDGGSIEYSDDTSLYGQTLKEPITSMIKIDTPEITVSNFEEKTVKIQLTPPGDSYQGVKMGVLVFALDQGDAASNGVSTEFAYRIGLITSESGDEFNNGQTLDLTSVKASMKRGKKMVLANLQNPEPKVIENLSIVATMTRKDSKEVVKRKTVEQYRVAPNSQFDFELDWGIEMMPSGTYTLTLHAENAYQEWTLSKDFTITNEQSRKMNKESAFKIVTPNWIQYLTIGLGTGTTLVTCALVFRRRKMEQEWKTLRLKKKRKKKKERPTQKMTMRGREI